ncbi:LysR substrate-binding domain-containing protein [Paralysiella testudinis]|uniref:LysR substrate-binding domain-containing protein n=1 Tax=Paralysiella testudinis TaxID=2809020 RepID=UPI002286EA23
MGATDNGTRSLGIPFALRLRRLAPRIKTSFFSIQGRDVAALLEQGGLDMAVMSDKAVPEHLHSRHLHHERYVCVVRQDHPVLQQTWDLDAFCALDYVLVSYFGGAFAGATDAALSALGRRRNVVMSVNNFLLVPDILRQSDWAAVVPDHLLQADDKLAVLAPPLAIEGYNKVMAWHERHHRDPVQRWLRDVMAGCE